MFTLYYIYIISIKQYMHISHHIYPYSYTYNHTQIHISKHHTYHIDIAYYIIIYNILLYIIYILYVCVVVPYSWTAGHFDPSAQYCTENWSPGATFIGMLTWTLKPSGVVTSTRVPGVALGSDTSVGLGRLEAVIFYAFHSFPINSHLFPCIPICSHEKKTPRKTCESQLKS